MDEKLKKIHSKLFTKEVAPFPVDGEKGISQILEHMSQTSFQARSLGQAYKIWKEALSGGATIFFGLAGALIPAGMRKVMEFLVSNHLIDVVVSTGANLFHDVHQSLGGIYYQCSPWADDKKLRQERFDRIYDAAASDREFEQLDEMMASFTRTLEPRAYGTREFFYSLGHTIERISEAPGLLTAAAKAGVPVYCPAMADSSFALALASERIKNNFRFSFDIIKDIVEFKEIIEASKDSAEIIMGGGTPKNFIQQAAVLFDLIGSSAKGYRYCIQVTSDAPHWGGLSGCTFEESTSWGKIHFDADKIAVYADATIALPLLAQALAEEKAWELRPHIPSFAMKETLEVKLVKTHSLAPNSSRSPSKVS